VPLKVLNFKVLNPKVLNLKVLNLKVRKIKVRKVKVLANTTLSPKVLNLNSVQEPLDASFPRKASVTNLLQIRISGVRKTASQAMRQTVR
jgi:hypothetical protein